MRRKEKAIVDRIELDEILSRANVCRLGLAGDRWPYVVPVHFGYDAEAIYFHSALEGRKVELLRQDPRVCVEVEEDVAVLAGRPACASTTRYRTVVAVGRAAFLESREEKRRGLALIVRQCGLDTCDFSDAAVDAVAVVRIALEELTGKGSPAASNAQGHPRDHGPRAA